MPHSQSGQESVQASQQNQERSGKGRAQSGHGMVFLALCVLVFAAGLSTLSTPLANATIISGYEIAFVLIYYLWSRTSSRDAEATKINSIIAIAIVAWFGSVTISLLASPLGVAGTWPGVLRYQQTVFHVIFFIAVRDFFSRFEPPVHWILLVIPASCLAVALGMAYLLLNLDHFDAATGELWFTDPPFNSHIRHTGYQVAAGVSALSVFFVSGSRVPVNRMLLLPVLVILCAFLLWMGGRGAVFSVLAAFGLLAFALWVKGVRSWNLWLAFSLSIGAGLLLSEWLAVFSWNGVVDLATRTVEAAGAKDLNQLATGRLGLWLTSWDSVKDHLLFGLGPQGYWFMPNRVFGIQPHSFLVQFLVEWGLVGGLLFLGLLLYGFWRGFLEHVVRARGGLDIASLSAGTMIVALTVHGLVDGTYYHPQPSLYLALGFAVWTLPRRAGRASAVAEAR